MRIWMTGLAMTKQVEARLAHTEAQVAARLAQVLRSKRRGLTPREVTATGRGSGCGVKQSKQRDETNRVEYKRME